MNSNNLIESLLELTNELSNKVKKLLEHSLLELNKKTNIDTWSALECIEHLNLYYEFYLPEISKRIIAKTDSSPTKYFKPGLIGGYFANAMKLDDGKLKKMNTFKDKNPKGSSLNYSSIHQFLNNQNKLIELLTKAKTINLNEVKTNITISKFFKLKLGDTFRFVIYHNERHIIQALRIL